MRESRLVLLILLGLAFAVLYVPVGQVSLLYDSMGYATQGMSLAQGQGNTVAVHDEQIPGIYPAGVPFLVSWAYRFCGDDLRVGIFSILFCGLVAVWACARVAGAEGGWAAAFTAGCLLLSSEVFRETSGMVLSQVPTAMMMFLAAMIWLRASNQRMCFIAGLIASGSLLFRFANITFPIALLMSEWIVGAWRPDGRRRRWFGLAAGVAVGGVALLFHNWLVYGSPTTTGYALWTFNVGSEFSLSHLGEFSELRFGQSWPLLSAFLGFGRLYRWPFVVLLGLGVAALWNRRVENQRGASLAVLAVVALLGQYAMLSLYFYKADLYQVSPLPLLAAVAGVGAVHWAGSWKKWAGPTLGVFLLAVSLGASAEESRPSLDARVRYANLLWAGETLADDAVLITSSEAPLVEHVFRRGTQRRVLYLGPFVSDLIGEVAAQELGAPQETPEAVVAYARERVREGLPVYFDRSKPPRSDLEAQSAIRKAMSQAFDQSRVGEEGEAGGNIYKIAPKVR